MSDHASGPRAVADPVVDITDMYVFPSPERPGILVLVLNVFPSAPAGALFSDAVDYRFRVRPAVIASSGAAAAFAVSEDEYTFNCRFAAPREGGTGGQLVQEGTCTASTGQVVSVRVNDEQGGQAEGLRVFAGAPVEFECRCNPARVAGVLRALGSEEIREVLREQGSVTVTCEFCQRPYSFDSIDIEALFADSVGGPEAIH